MGKSMRDETNRPGGYVGGIAKAAPGSDLIDINPPAPLRISGDSSAALERYGGRYRS